MPSSSFAAVFCVRLGRPSFSFLFFVGGSLGFVWSSLGLSDRFWGSTGGLILGLPFMECTNLFNIFILRNQTRIIRTAVGTRDNTVMSSYDSCDVGSTSISTLVRAQIMRNKTSCNNPQSITQHKRVRQGLFSKVTNKGARSKP